MFVAGMMEFALEVCAQGDIATSLLHWDQAVAIYTGSLDTDGSGDGNLLYALADQFCAAFASCDEEGTSSVNREIMDQFTTGQLSLATQKCDDAETNKDRIVALMAVPMIQGTLVNANMAVKDEINQAATFAFASVILPLIDKCSEDDARALYDAVQIPPSPEIGPADAILIISTVLEDSYDCLGLSKEDVGANGEGTEAPTLSPIIGDDTNGTRDVSASHTAVHKWQSVVLPLLLAMPMIR
jgi:hypothetical protein